MLSRRERGCFFQQLKRDGNYLICKPLLNHVTYHKPNQNRMKNKKVVDNRKQWREANFRLCDVTQPKLNMHKLNN